MSDDESTDTEPTDASGGPLRNGALVEAMRNVSVSDTPDTRALLFRLLLETSLLAVTPELPATSRAWTASAGETLNLVTLREGEATVLPLFTSAAAVTRWRPRGAGYVALASTAIFEMAAVHGTDKIVLDEGSPISGYLTRYEIEQLARGRLPLGPTGVVAEPTQVRIGRPQVPPSEELLTALREQLDAVPAAVRAWYFLMQQGVQAPEHVIAIQLQAGVEGDEAHRVIRKIVDGAGARSDAVRHLSVMVPDPHLLTTLASGSGQAFYPA